MDIDTFDRLSEISYRLECGTELLYALFCVLRHDDYTAKDFAPVMYAGHLYFSHLNDDLHKLIRQQEGALSHDR